MQRDPKEWARGKRTKHSPGDAGARREGGRRWRWDGWWDYGDPCSTEVIGEGHALGCREEEVEMVEMVESVQLPYEPMKQTVLKGRGISLS